MKNTISVIIPIYNVEKYLRQCLDSVLDQTIAFDEIILVNDGSTDRSREICIEYSLKYPFIKLIDQENSGPGEARNKGMQVASGDYIVFVDSDDMVSGKMCETIKRYTDDSNLDVLYYASTIQKDISVRIADDEYNRDLDFSGKVLKGFEALKKTFPMRYIMSVVMCAHRTEFLRKQKIEFIKGILYEDRYFCLRVITEAQRVMFITDRLYIRRFRSGSIVTSAASKKKIEDVILGHRREWDYIRNNSNWIEEKGLTQYFAICGALMVYQNDVSSCEHVEQRKKYLETFLEEWITYFDLSIMNENELCGLLQLLKYVEMCDNQELKRMLEDVGGLTQYKLTLADLLTQNCIYKLKQLPLNCNNEIGIYGMGKHTKCLLKMYEKLVGKIGARITYIVSNKDGISVTDNEKVKTTEELSGRADFYLISSKMYQVDMYKELIRRGIDPNKIIKLYKETDYADYTMFYSALYE